ncbi:ribosomal RNA large subunit methyltransferase J, variant [Loa loa]|uniref:rRNA methyltransferase 2, mitochondrial n=1 Tax=Loa loa TaxID=7209 RepID=A0A1S0UJ44_LOALO|nr:ribosomal RNA large subunit methyltransferase J, variant [Loa loa]EJD75471.1 ribosomal RNA large subunit methyltransferase J, variant [Loa loa]
MFFNAKLTARLITFRLPVRYFSKSKKSTATLKYLRKQCSDEFSRKAREHSYRARSAYKLLEINEKYKIIEPGMVVVDVGAAPGSWCQVVADIVQPNVYGDAFVLGIDLQPIMPVSGVNFLDLSDITAQKTHENIKQLLNGRSVDVVISDMAPNPTGKRRNWQLKISSNSQIAAPR